MPDESGAPSPVASAPDAQALPQAILDWLDDPGPKPTPGCEHVPDPADTLARIRPLARTLGVTRVADITGLDHVGLPVATACRPNARSLAVSQGKGVTPDAARASALMEAVEAAHAERPRLPLRLAREVELDAVGEPVVRPLELPQRVAGLYHDHLPLLWAEARDLTTGQFTWVPYDAVHLDLTLPAGLAGPGGWYRPTSNGLASGNTMAEALAHALCELIERDATTLWEAAGPSHQTATRIDPDSVDDPVVRDLLACYRAASVDVALYDLTSDLGVPVILCHIADHERNPFRPLPTAGGVGCHLHAPTAMVRALTEAAQSRLVNIAGARDDLPRAEYTRWQDANDGWADRIAPLPPGTQSLAAVPDLAGSSLTDDIASLVHLVHRAGLTAVAVDLTDPALGIPVVRVVVPRLEGPPATMVGGPAPLGSRGRAAARLGAVDRTATTVATPDPAASPPATPAGGAAGMGTRRQTSRPVVFVGPSLLRNDVTTRLDADVRPPAAQGDVARAAAARPPAIVLIDGAYEGVPAVWHKEILWALQTGVPIYGAASMGALRAAELDRFGMAGVGQVYLDVATGLIASDDEVAVAHAGDEDDFAPLSVALVDIRATLDAAVTVGIVTTADADIVLAGAGGLFYPQRTWPTVLAVAGHRGLDPAIAEALASWVTDNAVHRKRADAEAVLDRVRQDLAAQAIGSVPPTDVSGRWRLERTNQWRQTEAHLGLPPDAGALPDDGLGALLGDDLLDELRLDDVYFDVHQACLLATLASALARHLGIDRGGDPVDMLRHGLGLTDEQSLHRWLADNQADEADLARLAAHQADLIWAHEWGHDEAPSRVADHLRLRGRFASFADRARSKRHRLAASGLDNPGLAEADITEAELWRWWFTRADPAGAVPPDIERHALQLGFDSEGAFRRAVLRTYCDEQLPAIRTGRGPR